MFLIFGLASGSRHIGTRKCRFFSCCGCYDASGAVICTYEQFTFFFLPIFRFGKRYYVTCPSCGSVYEMSREEGKRLEKDANAEINPEKIYVVKRTNNKVCPNCRRVVDASSRYCPNCGTNLV